MTAITIRGVEEEVKHQLEISAKQQGLALSAYLRMVLNNMVNHNAYDDKHGRLLKSPVRSKFQETVGQKAVREIRELVMEDNVQDEDFDWETFINQRRKTHRMISNLEFGGAI